MRNFLISARLQVLCLEGVIGKYFNLPLVSSYGKVAGRPGRFFGWLAIIAVTTIGGFYMLLTGWTVAYGYFVVTDSIPADSLAFLNESFLCKSSSITQWGCFAGFMFARTVAIACFAWYVVSRNISSGIEKICSIFLPLLTILIVGFTIEYFYGQGREIYFALSFYCFHKITCFDERPYCCFIAFFCAILLLYLRK